MQDMSSIPSTSLPVGNHPPVVANPKITLPENSWVVYAARGRNHFARLTTVNGALILADGQGVPGDSDPVFRCRFENGKLMPCSVAPTSIVVDAMNSATGRAFKKRAIVLAYINNIIGSIPAVVVRDRTDDESACRGLRLEGERVYEVQYTDGEHRGQYADIPARSLQAV